MNLRHLGEKCTDNEPKLQLLFPIGPHLTLAGEAEQKSAMLSTWTLKKTSVQLTIQIFTK